MSSEGVKQMRGRQAPPKHERKSAPIIKNIDDEEQNELSDEEERFTDGEEEINTEDNITSVINAEYINLPDIVKEIFENKHIDINNAFTVYGFFDVSHNLDNECNFKKCGKNNDIYMIRYVIVAIKNNNKRISFDSFLKTHSKYDLIKYSSINVFINEKYNKKLLEVLNEQKDNRQKKISINSFKLVENKNKEFGDYSLKLIGNTSFLDNDDIIDKLKDTPINNNIKSAFKHSITKYMEGTKDFTDFMNELEDI